ncbi:MAG: nicotinamidase [Desulfuromonadaceae bacterium]|nr:nicotinamidase [Desulfuromonadaceae bacterium]
MKISAALLIVDVQNDFCPGGALAVPDGDRVVEPLSRIAGCFAAAGLLVLASRDWHPPETKHFMAFGGLWPPHCVKGTPGAEFHPGLRLPVGTVVISKGGAPDSDAYSAFDGQGTDGSSLGDTLTTLQVDHLYVGGLATDYCVRASVLDARKRGLEVTLLTDATAAVEVVAGDAENALNAMKNAGVSFRTTDESIALITEGRV